MTEDKLNSLYVTFTKKLEVYVENSDLLITSLGDNLKNAPAAQKLDSGLAYNGAMMYNTLYRIAKYAKNINAMLDENTRVDDKSLFKVVLLHQISKAVMFTPNDNEWEINKLGSVYKFNDLSGALRMGERSILICSQNGITFTEEEFEAMRILDKSDENDNFTKYFSSPLSVIIKQANELANISAKNSIKK